MEIKTKQILRVMHIISWIIFIGLCIKTGAILFSFIVSLAINPDGAKNLHLGLDLSSLYEYDRGHYISVVVYIIGLSALKAWLFYLVIKVFMKINFVHPFSTAVSSLISRISRVALTIGLFTVAANGYCKWLMKKGVSFPDLEDHLSGAGEFLMLAGIIFIIAQVFKKGIEIQSENELTV